MIERDPYDAVAYPGHAYPDTHPDRIAVMGLLHGLEPATVEHCRVLEIGSGDGANLIPMAYAIPGGEFVGFDLAELPVARGQRRIRELGLVNIRLFQADLMDVRGLGQFDYVIANGLYAWVPESARDRLLAICREHLAPNGLAFVSYNTLPGGHVRNMVREMMFAQGAGIEDPGQKVAEALGFLRLMVEARAEGDPFRAVLEHELKRMEQRDLRVVFHDELASAGRPVSFTEFADHARKNGLQYVSESVLPPPNDPCFQRRIVDKAEELAAGDRVVEEQIYDFARMRMYRETLLCHADRAVSGEMCVEAFTRMRLASQATASDGEGDVLRVFTLPGGIRMESRHRNTVLLMETLIEAWPRSVPFAELMETLGASGVEAGGEFFKLLLQLVVARMVELHVWQAPVGGGMGERPRASAIARQEAVAQDHATTLLHAALLLNDPLVREFVLLLDGTRDRAELLAALREKRPDLSEANLAEGLEPTLRMLHRTGVLLGDG